MVFGDVDLKSTSRVTIFPYLQSDIATQVIGNIDLTLRDTASL